MPLRDHPKTIAAVMRWAVSPAAPAVRSVDLRECVFRTGVEVVIKWRDAGGRDFGLMNTFDRDVEAWCDQDIETFIGHTLACRVANAERKARPADYVAKLEQQFRPVTQPTPAEIDALVRLCDATREEEARLIAAIDFDAEAELAKLIEFKPGSPESWRDRPPLL